MTRDDMVAALERAITLTPKTGDIALLCALADAIEQAQDSYQIGASWHKQWDSQTITPNYWIIPAPRLP